MGLWGKFLGLESEVQIHRIGALIKETSRLAPLPLPSSEGNRGKTAICELRSKRSSGMESAGVLILDIPASRTERNFCCLQASQSVVFLLQLLKMD